MKITSQSVGLLAILVLSQFVFFAYVTGNLYTPQSDQVQILAPAISNTPNYWNNRSQAVADYLVGHAWNPTIGLLTDPEAGCTDYVDGLPCRNNAWTTSDNVPTCWTLADYGYASIMQDCESSAASLGAFSYNNGMRYESYTGNPIVQGNPQDQHTILQPVNGTNHIVCTNTPCLGHSYGTLGDGEPYGIECDCWNGNGGSGSPNINAGVDIAAPQAVDAWLFGNLNLFTSIENNLVARYTSSNYVGTGSTWQLGQVMFVMRIGGEDNTTAFTNMANELWSLQNKAGYLPNTYSGFGQPVGSSHDPENQDAGLLPYSTSVISQVKSDFGAYSNSGSTQTITKTVTLTHTIALSTTTKTAIITTIRKLTTSTQTDTTCCKTSTVTTITPVTVSSTSTICCAISTFTLTSTFVTSSTSVIPTTTTIQKTNTGSTTTTITNTYVFTSNVTAYSILQTTISYSTTITSSATTTLYSIIPTTITNTASTTVTATSAPTITVTCTTVVNGSSSC